MKYQKTRMHPHKFQPMYYVKVHVFWEGHKNWQNLTVNLTVKISSIFVAFLENMNFIQ